MLSVRTFYAGTLLAFSICSVAQSPYIHKVYDFMPAPGQFTNDMPAYVPGDTRADMIRKAEDAIANDNQGMISLGGYGGYVVFGFDHEVENKPGKYDFKILGNAFYAGDNPNGEASPEGGSCEPGIVMVSRDANGNGLPDDAWYELAGSEYNRPQTVKRYQITYHKPATDKPLVPHPTDRNINDVECVRWTTNGYGAGYLFRNVYHHQPYYPQWITDESITFEGTKLADNYVDESGGGSYFVLYAYQWGYADNHPNLDNRSGFNIEWAVDANGSRVNLSGVHFVKVYTGVNQNCGWIGETSTEILGAEDLHLTGRDAAVPVFVQSISLNRAEVEMQPGESITLTAAITPTNADNKAITWRSSLPSVAAVNAAGTITAASQGTTLIRAISADGYQTAVCTVTVRTTDPQPGGDVSVTGVILSRYTMDLQVGEMAVLTATVLPANAANRAVIWTSSNSDVAEVTVNGAVIAFADGTAILTVTTADGGYVARCLLTVGDVSATEQVGGGAVAVGYEAGDLRLFNLEGYRCTLVSLNGQVLSIFTASSSEERLPLHLRRGLYILNVQKYGVSKAFKFIVR